MNEDNKPLPITGRRVRVQKAPVDTPKIDFDELCAQLCYYFPQYKFHEARNLSLRRVKLLLNVAKKQEAIHFYNLTQISAAPHTEKGKGVKTLSEHFKNIAKS